MEAVLRAAGLTQPAGMGTNIGMGVGSILLEVMHHIVGNLTATPAGRANQMLLGMLQPERCVWVLVKEHSKREGRCSVHNQQAWA